jgi:hypothetical protein
VRRIGHEDFGAFEIAARFVVSLHDHQTDEFAVRSGEGIEREFRQSRDFRKHSLKFVVEFQRALNAACALQGMDLIERRNGGHFFVDFGVVLHRAAAQADKIRFRRRGF